jgi:adenine-specific DNA-methyltransferase
LSCGKRLSTEAFDLCETNDLKVRPTSYAESIGKEYSGTVSSDYRRSKGQFITPTVLADYMASFFTSRTGPVSVLDPGAGTGVLSCALCEKLISDFSISKIDLTLYEFDKEVIPCLHQSMKYLREYACSKGTDLKIEIKEMDFVLNNSALLSEQTLFDPESSSHRLFDYVIANPPYFKISSSGSLASAYKNLAKGYSNVYALFMLVGSRLLKDGGELVFITPRSYSSGQYFEKLRAHLFKSVRPVRFHVFESRKEAFKNHNVLQENVIFMGIRSSDWLTTDLSAKDKMITVSSSRGIADLSERSSVEITVDELFIDKETHSFVLPVNSEQKKAIDQVEAWQNKLRDFGMKTSTGPIVAFRSKEWLTENCSDPSSSIIPLIKMSNIKPMKIAMPLMSTSNFLITQESKKLLIPNDNYVLVKRFSSKEEERRLVASPWFKRQSACEYIALENHVNYIHNLTRSMSEKEVAGIALLLSTRLYDAYFRTIGGSTQVNAGDIEGFRWPSLSAVIDLGGLFLERQAEASEAERILSSYLLSKGG